MTSRRRVMSIMRTMTGGATTPLMTALQNSAFTGSTENADKPPPTIVASAIVA